ncbi:MAG: 16S rRNA processing protein RimM [Clostridia bacterium]|nr:16S rRNA processing protein RimM [Clostridia bacterium]
MEFIEIGKIVGTHGIRGEVKLVAWTDDLYDLLEAKVFYLKDGTPLHVEKSRVHKNALIIKFREISDMNEAESKRGIVLYTEKTPLPEGRFYIKDLIGLNAVTDGAVFGKLTDVFNTGANDIYEIKTDAGKTLYLPVIDGVIDSVDLKAHKIYVTIPEGLED